MSEYIKFSDEIIDMLEKDNMQLSQQIKNTIQLIIFETFEKGKEIGEKQGIGIGIRKACNDFEKLTSELKKI